MAVTTPTVLPVEPYVDRPFRWRTRIVVGGPGRQPSREAPPDDKEPT